MFSAENEQVALRRDELCVLDLGRRVGFCINCASLDLGRRVRLRINCAFLLLDAELNSAF